LQLVHAGLVKRSTTLWFYIDGAQNNEPLLNFLENSYNNARATRLCAAQKLGIFCNITNDNVVAKVSLGVSERCLRA
jgi:hypothetical protein